MTSANGGNVWKVAHDGCERCRGYIINRYPEAVTLFRHALYGSTNRCTTLFVVMGCSPVSDIFLMAGQSDND